MSKRFLILLFSTIIAVHALSACQSSEEEINKDIDNLVDSINAQFEDEETETQDSVPSTESYSEPNENETSPYTKEELESDSKAPSTNPEDYNSDGEYVPSGGVSDDPADYNSKGEYQPVEDMTQEEIQAGLEEMFGN